MFWARSMLSVPGATPLASSLFWHVDFPCPFDGPKSFFSMGTPQVAVDASLFAGHSRLHKATDFVVAKVTGHRRKLTASTTCAKKEPTQSDPLTNLAASAYSSTGLPAVPRCPSSSLPVTPCYEQYSGYATRNRGNNQG